MIQSAAIEQIVPHSVLSWSTTYSQIADDAAVRARPAMKAQAPPSVRSPSRISLDLVLADVLAELRQRSRR